jgi:hypothetical protein
VNKTAIIVLSAAILATAVTAQITIAPAGSATESRPAARAPSIEDLPKLSEQLRSDRGWWKAYRDLVKLAEGEHEAEVLEEMGNLWRACEDEAVRERTMLVPARLNRGTHFRQRREALDEELTGLVRLTGRLEASIKDLKGGNEVKELRETAAALGLKIARLQKTLAEFDDRDPEFGKPAGPLTIGVGDDDEEGFEVEPASAPASRPDEKGKQAEPRDDRAKGLSAGDPRRVDWVRPFKDALAKARETNRVLLVKPLMGGSNVPDPAGTPCGGKKDCEGSW